MSIEEERVAWRAQGWVWAHDTAHENILMCQPQQRNMAGRIFGGFLMRRAFELAFSTCYAFAGTRPAFLLVDDITFRRPVDVGDLLRLKSHVLHVEHKYNPGPPWLGAQTASHAVIHVAVRS
jgi:acyl-coenzyme A thioesterase 9